jgi:hypothetical protein
LDEVLDGRDLTSAILARWVAALIDDQPQLLRPGSGNLQRPQRSLTNSDEALAVANAIDETNSGRISLSAGSVFLLVARVSVPTTSAFVSVAIENSHKQKSGVAVTLASNVSALGADSAI